MPLLPSAGAPLHIDCSRSRPVQQWTPASPPAAQMEHRSRSPFKSSHLPSFLGARSRRRRCRRGWGRRRSSPASSGNLLAPPFISRSLLPLALPLFLLGVGDALASLSALTPRRRLKNYGPAPGLLAGLPFVLRPAPGSYSRPALCMVS